ncbi:uncharacterized protein K452DRAFT_286450 [Aplosporella prunicola CBS 121167]|uniref:Secreted protein n=1 Tax=Aplosporella prunicola CBS 121167 TaxID=1176127 RepID=A0A6A6BHL5_9PEZI|nr:uncharacterized protein K452DRAFT_286450 [Aplosporella prunicola CBS 121167]KAF2142825.1 hypothetical protein K452DRAFT_286450 [Aplosporella prunicola CBS 121167]
MARWASLILKSWGLSLSTDRCCPLIHQRSPISGCGCRGSWSGNRALPAPTLHWSHPGLSSFPEANPPSPHPLSGASGGV